MRELRLEKPPPEWQLFIFNEIEVLIAKVPKENPYDYEIISAPKWFKKL
ncbi:MAG: hypothetical protein QXP60_05365 [Nitrososphaerota archaeon]